MLRVVRNAVSPADERSTSYPDASIVVPVNAQGDIPAAVELLSDLGRYDGPHRLDIILVVNNYPDDQPPREIDDLRRVGARVIAVPSIRQSGYSVGITARAHGLRAADVEASILFDADCRVPHPTPLVNWYVSVLAGGAAAAYTGVGHHELPSGVTVRLRVFIHHAGRWAKRVLFGIPTIRGSNYAVMRTQFLELFDRGLIVHDMNVGPAIKSSGGRIEYSGAANMRVLTSGRFLRPGWMRLLRYIPKRIAYNVRMRRG